MRRADIAVGVEVVVGRRTPRLWKAAIAGGAVAFAWGCIAIFLAVCDGEPWLRPLALAAAGAGVYGCGRVGAWWSTG